jgi:DNA-binding NarL/FixJ family response regulator
MNLNCVFVDDELHSMGCLLRYIERTPILKLLFHTKNSVEAKQFISNNEIDLLITDIQMPHLSGIELAESFKNKFEVIFITGYSETIVNALQISPIAILTKPFSFETFEQAISKAIKIISYNKGLEKIDSEIIENKFLTKTELEILTLIGNGKTSKEIADAKFITLKTVENHRQNIREKLDLKGKHTLTLYAKEFVEKLK